MRFLPQPLLLVCWPRGMEAAQEIGLATKYPGDVDLENDPDVLLVESFDPVLPPPVEGRGLAQQQAPPNPRPPTRRGTVWIDGVLARRYVGPMTKR